MQEYFERLVVVLDEYGAAFESLSVLVRLWGDENLHLERPITRGNVVRARDNLEFTYFIRLHAEFESILKDDVQSHHGNIENDPKVRELVSLALRLRGKRRKSLDPDSRLFSRLELIHQHRNRVVHGDSSGPQSTLKEALNAFNTFLARLTAP